MNEKYSPWSVDKDNVVVPGQNATPIEEVEEGGRGFGKALIFGIVLAVFAAGAGTLWFITRPTNAPHVTLQMSGGQNLFSGVVAKVNIVVTNASQLPLRGATLSFYLPDDIYFPSANEDGQKFVQQTLGDIAPGAVASADFSFVPMTPQQSVRKVRAELQYEAGQNGTSKFTNKQEFDVNITRAGVDLQLTTPNQVFSNQQFGMTVKYRNVSGVPLKDIEIRAVYPPSFQFNSSTPSTTKYTSIWKLGDMATDANGQITIQGQVAAAENSAHQFSFYAESGNDTNARQLAKQDATLSVALMPIALTMSVNDKDDGSALVSPRQHLRYAIKFKNNSNFTIRDGKIALTMKGNMADISGLQGATYFDSAKGAQIWTAATNPQLSEISPGEEGVVMGDVDVLDNFPAGVVNDVVTAEAILTSTSLPQGTTGNLTESRASVSAKISGQSDFAGTIFWRDTAARIVNSGVFPPRVGKPTQFTVHWRVEAAGEALSGLHMESHVLSGAKYTGKVKLSGTTIAPQFNPDSGLLIWDLPQVNPAGMGKAAVEAVFQLELTPTVNQVGNVADLLDTTSVRASGAFSGRSITDSLNKLDSGARDDTSISGSRNIRL
jgi:hypothetical protein